MNHMTRRNAGSSSSGRTSIDTTFVLFFLALEYGRAVQVFSIDGLLMGITIMMVLVLPYFLIAEAERAEFGIWLAGRSAVALLGVVSGYAFKLAVGVFLPEGLSFVPMMLLIVAAMVSAYVQFYGLMKLRLAK